MDRWWGCSIAFTGVVLTGWLVYRADLAIRKDQLHKARMLALTLNLQSMCCLSGTVEDVKRPEYLRLKRQLRSVSEMDKNCRFLYLMGRRNDGKVFFYVDNEPLGSKDESVAGEIYKDIPASYQRVFDTKSALTVGPETDRWGTWITSLIPIKDPKSNKFFVLGMDMDARNWRMA